MLIEKNSGNGFTQTKKMKSSMKPQQAAYPYFRHSAFG